MFNYKEIAMMKISINHSDVSDCATETKHTLIKALAKSVCLDNIQ